MQWSTLGKLWYLPLANNRLSGTAPPEWGAGMTLLGRMGLMNNTGLRGTLPAAWSGMTNLRGLDVRGTSFSGKARTFDLAHLGRSHGPVLRHAGPYSPVSQATLQGLCGRPWRPLQAPVTL